MEHVPIGPEPCASNYILFFNVAFYGQQGERSKREDLLHALCHICSDFKFVTCVIKNVTIVNDTSRVVH
jgi:hypothetical protein